MRKEMGSFKPYEQQQALLERLESLNGQDGKVRIAAGMSEWQPGKDESAANVFARADIMMYQRKSEIKAEARQRAEAAYL